MRKLKSAIEMAVPGVEVVCRVGRRTSFEVVVNGTLIHSKLGVGKLPDYEQTVEIIKSVVDGREPQKVTKMKHSCNII
jgi:selenoprotein W-related protein